MNHWFWLGLIGIITLWYLIVTILVAFRGGKNIRELIEQLKNNG